LTASEFSPNTSVAQPPRARVGTYRGGVLEAFVLLAVAALSVFMGWNVARGSILAVLPMVLGLFALLIALRPDVLFVGWLLAAPFIQETARDSLVGLGLTTAFYALPPLVLAMHTVRSNSLARHVRWYDTLPAAYVAIILLSQGFVDSSQLKAFGFYSGMLHESVAVGVIMYYVCAFGPLGRLKARTFASALLLGVSLVSALGIVQHYTAWTLWGGQLLDDPPRISATLVSPVIYGIFVGAGIVTSIAILVLDGPRSLRRLAFLTLALGLPALFFTFTRGCILATFVVASVVAFVPRRTRVPALGVALVAAIAVAASWGTITQSSLYQKRASNQENVSGRFVMARAALDLVEEKPVLGWGYGQYDFAKGTLETSTGSLSEESLYAYTSHNTFLTIVVELGIVGLLVLVLPWAIVVAQSIRQARAGIGFPAWLTVSLIGTLAVYVLAALTSDTRFFSFVPATAWVAIGLLRRQLWDPAAGA
jgi:O-antigen ligase